MRGKYFPIFAMALMGGCASNSFTDRSPGLSFSLPDQTIAQTERSQIKKYQALLTADGVKESARSYRNSVIWQQMGADDERFGIFVRAV